MAMGQGIASSMRHKCFCVSGRDQPGRISDQDKNPDIMMAGKWKTFLGGILHLEFDSVQIG